MLFIYAECPGKQARLEISVPDPLHFDTAPDPT